MLLNIGSSFPHQTRVKSGRVVNAETMGWKCGEWHFVITGWVTLPVFFFVFICSDSSFFFLNRGEFCWKNSCHEERGCSLIFIKLKIWVWEREWNHLMTWTLKRGKVQINPFCCSLNIPFFFFLYRPSSFYSLLFFFLFST